MNYSVGLYGESEMSNRDLINLFRGTRYEGFSYTLRGLGNEKPNVSDAFKLLRNWIANPKIELLVKAGLKKLALSDRFLRMTEKKQKEVIKAAKRAPKEANLNELLIMADTGCGYDLVPFRGDPKLPDYLMAQSEYAEYYFDYLRMAKKLKKNLKDNYWRYPKNLVKAHNKCVDELEAIEEAKRLAEEEEKERKEARTYSKIKSLAKKLSILNAEIGGYEISVAKDIEDIREQAEKLSQCLITCEYFKKHAEKKCILVFVKRKRRRIATAEIRYDAENTLGQFYANERNRDKCHPTEAVKSAMRSWIKDIYIPSGIPAR